MCYGFSSDIPLAFTNNAYPVTLDISTCLSRGVGSQNTLEVIIFTTVSQDDIKQKVHIVKVSTIQKKD